MKTISPGDLSRTIPWFLRRTFTCEVCGCVAQPETEGEVEVWEGRHLDGDPPYYASIKCPTCGHTVVIGSDGDGDFEEVE